MKKLFLVLALLVMGVFINSQGAFAVCNRDTDRFDGHGWCIDHQGQLTPMTGLTVNSDQLVSQGGYQVPVIRVTAANTPRTMLASESGSVLTDMGGVTIDTLSGSGSKYTLPRAVVGLIYTFNVGTKSTITVDTLDNSDIILNSISGTGMLQGDSFKSTGQAGDTVTLVATAANQWTVTSERGAWTNNSTN